jgi:hypothetical protein
MGEWKYSSTHTYLSTKRRWEVSCTPRPLYPLRNSSRYPMCRGLGEPRSQSGRCGYEKNLLPSSDIELRFLGLPATGIEICLLVNKCCGVWKSCADLCAKCRHEWKLWIKVTLRSFQLQFYNIVILFTLPYISQWQCCNISVHSFLFISIRNNHLNELIYLTFQWIILYKTVLNKLIYLIWQLFILYETVLTILVYFICIV